MQLPANNRTNMQYQQCRCFFFSSELWMHKKIILEKHFLKNWNRGWRWMSWHSTSFNFQLLGSNPYVYLYFFHLLLYEMVFILILDLLIHTGTGTCTYTFKSFNKRWTSCIKWLKSSSYFSITLSLMFLLYKINKIFYLKSIMKVQHP